MRFATAIYICLIVFILIVLSTPFPVAAACPEGFVQIVHEVPEESPTKVCIAKDKIEAIGVDPKTGLYVIMTKGFTFVTKELPKL